MRTLILLTVSFLSWAADPVTLALEQAQAFAIKKNRQQACAILRRAADLNPKSRQKVIDQLHNMAKVFFTDKGQKAFEAGQASMFENPDMALTQYRQSLELEDDNVLVLASMAKIHLSKQDCESAATLLQKARLLDPYFGEAAVLEARTLICGKKSEALKDKLKTLPVLDKWEESFVQYLSAQENLLQGQPRRAFESLSRVTEDHPQFPEAYYFLAKAGQEVGKDVEVWQQKYVSLCKSVSSRERKKFSLEPRLCVSVKEVEDELSKNSAEI